MSVRSLRPWAALATGALLLGSCEGLPGRLPSLPPAREGSSEEIVRGDYNQGVARAPGGWIFSGTNGLWRTDEALVEIRARVPAVPPEWKARGYGHVGDIDVAGGWVFAPWEHPRHERREQAVARYDLETLEFVDVVLLPQHENSFVAVDAASMTAYSMDRFDGDALLRYDVAAGWKALPPLALSERLFRTQGADVLGNAVWVSTSDARNGIYRVDLATGRVEAAGSAGHEGAEGEGIDATPLPCGLLHTLTVGGGRVAWFGHFAAPAVAELPAGEASAGLADRPRRR